MCSPLVLERLCSRLHQHPQFQYELPQNKQQDLIKNTQIQKRQISVSASSGGNAKYSPRNPALLQTAKATTFKKPHPLRYEDMVLFF